MKPLVIASNCLNEIDQCKDWCKNIKQMVDAGLCANGGGILCVDGGSTDGTQKFLSDRGVIVVEDNIIQREGYGPARNHLRRESLKWFPNAHWMIYIDFDERILESEFHQLRFLKDYLSENYDVIALPRIDWHDWEMTKAEKDYHTQPDWQARMTRLRSPLQYIRRLHEQLTDFIEIYTSLATPKINHFHRCATQEKRDFIGKICAKLHMEDEYGDTYPMHHKEQYYRNLLEKEGL